eukprot:13902571-Ditylum_brightwellii.AAC.1
MVQTTLFKQRMYVYLLPQRHMTKQQNTKLPSAMKVKSQMSKLKKGTIIAVMVISGYVLKLLKDESASNKDVDGNKGILTKYLVYAHIRIGPCVAEVSLIEVLHSPAAISAHPHICKSSLLPLAAAAAAQRMHTWGKFSTNATG